MKQNNRSILDYIRIISAGHFICLNILLYLFRNQYYFNFRQHKLIHHRSMTQFSLLQSRNACAAQLESPTHPINSTILTSQMKSPNHSSNIKKTNNSWQEGLWFRPQHQGFWTLQLQLQLHWPHLYSGVLEQQKLQLQLHWPYLSAISPILKDSDKTATKI